MSFGSRPTLELSQSAQTSDVRQSAAGTPSHKSSSSNVVGADTGDSLEAEHKSRASQEARQKTGTRGVGSCLRCLVPSPAARLEHTEETLAALREERDRLANKKSNSQAEVLQHAQFVAAAEHRAVAFEARARAATLESDKARASIDAMVSESSAKVGQLRVRLMDISSQCRALIQGLPRWHAGHQCLLGELSDQRGRLTAHLADRDRLQSLLIADMHTLRETSAALMELGDRQLCDLAAVRTQNDQHISELERVTRDVGQLQDTYWDDVPWFSGTDTAEVKRLRFSVQENDLKSSKLEKDLSDMQRLADAAAAEARQARSQMQLLQKQSFEEKDDCHDEEVPPTRLGIAVPPTKLGVAAAKLPRSPAKPLPRPPAEMERRVSDSAASDVQATNSALRKEIATRREELRLQEREHVEQRHLEAEIALQRETVQQERLRWEIASQSVGLAARVAADHRREPSTQEVPDAQHPSELLRLEEVEQQRLLRETMLQRERLEQEKLRKEIAARASGTTDNIVLRQNHPRLAQDQRSSGKGYADEKLALVTTREQLQECQEQDRVEDTPRIQAVAIAPFYGSHVHLGGSVFQCGWKLPTHLPPPPEPVVPFRNNTLTQGPLSVH